MANANLAELQQYYSGGGSNSVTTASIGGAISSARVLSQSVSSFTTMTGVTVDDAMGNGVGDGTFVYTASGTTAQWSPNGGALGDGLDISSGGVFFVQGANNGGGLCVTVSAVDLPTSNVTNTLTVANLTEKHFLNQTKDESDVGVTKYHCFAYKNTSSETMKNITLYISENTPGADTISIGLDPLAASDGSVGPTAVANENTAPSGVTFYAPTSKDDTSALVIGDLLPGECRFYWVKQLTPPEVDVATIANTYQIGIYMRG